MEAQAENAFQILDEQVLYDCDIPKQWKFDTFSIYLPGNIHLNEEILFGMNKSNLFLTLATRGKPFSRQTTAWKKSRDNVLKKIIILPE